MTNAYFSNKTIADIGNVIKLQIHKGAFGPAENTIKSLYNLFNRALNSKVDVEDQGFLIDVLQECQTELDEAREPEMTFKDEYVVYLGSALHEIIELTLENQELQRQIQCLKDDREHLQDVCESQFQEFCDLREERDKLQEELDGMKNPVVFAGTKPEDMMGMPKMHGARVILDNDGFCRTRATEHEICCATCKENHPDGHTGCMHGMLYSNACLGTGWPFEYNRWSKKQ